MSLETYRKKLQIFFRKLEAENAEPTEWYINNVFNTSSDDFIKLVICYVFFHYEKGKRTFVYKDFVNEIIQKKQLKLKL